VAGCGQRFHVARNLAPTVDGVIEDGDGIDVPGGREVIELFFPKIDDVLGIADEGQHQPGELVKDGYPPAEGMSGLSTVVLEPEAGVIC
jgi:hypothetical protein